MEAEAGFPGTAAGVGGASWRMKVITAPAGADAATYEEARLHRPPAMRQRWHGPHCLAVAVQPASFLPHFQQEAAMRAVAVWAIVPVFFLAIGEAAAQDPADCGPIRVPWSNSNYATSGDYLLTISKDGDGNHKGVISGFTSDKPGFESQNGSVHSLKIDGSSVSFSSQTASFDLTIDDCKVTALTGYATHRMAGRQRLGLGR